MRILKLLPLQGAGRNAVYTEVLQVASCRPRRGRTVARQDVVRPLWGRFLPPDACPQVP